MCRVKPINRGGREILLCDKTKKLIVVHTEIGSFCEEMCDFDLVLFSKSRAHRLMEDMGPIMTVPVKLRDKDE